MSERIRIGGKTQADLDAEYAEEDRQRTNAIARTYLQETDWYVIRETETGTPAPRELHVLRQVARNRIVENVE